jgi:trans-2,3-dihydro-3-hydroxyanthranilate isomerase
MRHRFYTADVFTDQRYCGNPLAVFPDARGIPESQLQPIAREFNLSETAFVVPPGDARHTRRVRIFTPAAEIPFAGHPTLGTAFILASIGDLRLEGERTQIVLEEGVGPVPVTIVAHAGRPIFTELTAARLPEFGPEPPPRAQLAEALSLDETDLLDGDRAPQGVSCGLPFLFVMVRGRDALSRARPDMAAWQRVLGSWWSRDVFVFAADPERPGSDLRARMFAPLEGIPEDPATGSAAAALAGYLGTRAALRDGTLRWVVEQGFEMGRPSLLHVEADKRAGAITDVRVGGASVMMMRGEIDI